MITKVVGSETVSSQPKRAASSSSPEFMNVLKEKFAEVTQRLRDVPGMPPGVFSINPPVEPQAIPSLSVLLD